MTDETAEPAVPEWPDDEGLADLAGETILERGYGYLDQVRNLRVDGQRATATVVGSSRYRVDLSVPGDGLVDGSCTCPHFADGNFCKHLVAVTICARDATMGGGGEIGGTDSDEAVASSTHPIVTYLESLGAPELRHLLIEAAESDESLHRSLSIRASVGAGSESDVAAELKAMAQSALRTGGFVDYGRSFHVAREAGELLEELERVLDSGGADTARPALLKSLTRLRAITLNGDDSAGVLGDEGQRAAQLYARACCEGNPDPVALAKWLVKFRDDSPGWPDVTLAMFVDAFDDKALATYRRGVDKVAAAREGDSYGRFEARRMLLELADHDHNLDAAISLLTEDEGHERYGAIIERCRAAGRDGLAARWLDRAIAGGAVNPSDRQHNDFAIESLDAAKSLHEDGRTEDALLLLRGFVSRHASAVAYRDLLSFAEEIGEVDVQREWALAELDRQAERLGSGDSLIQVLLDEGDVAGAKAAANRHGCLNGWPRLAQACAKDDPGWVADRELPRLREALVPTNSANYPGIAQGLAGLKELYEAADRADEFEDVIDGVRTDYRRRPALVKALDRQGL